MVVRLVILLIAGLRIRHVVDAHSLCRTKQLSVHFVPVETELLLFQELSSITHPFELIPIDSRDYLWVFVLDSLRILLMIATTQAEPVMHLKLVVQSQGVGLSRLDESPQQRIICIPAIFICS